MRGTDLSKDSKRNKHFGVRTPTSSPVPRQLIPSAIMGVKVLHCFPWQRRCKERAKRHRPLQAVPPVDPPAYLSPTAAWCSTGEGGASDRDTRQVYLSHKACVTLRHQMDCNVIDATY